MVVLVWVSVCVLKSGDYVCVCDRWKAQRVWLAEGVV